MPPKLPAEVRLLLRQSAWWHLVTAGPLAVALAIYGHVEMAWGVALGALFMCANFTLMTRILTRIVDGADGPGSPRSKALILPLMMRWPLLALALVGILWYMPARPEGVLLGVGLSLLSTVLAALQTRGSKRPPPDPSRTDRAPPS